MPLRLDIKRKLSSRSERVKSVDLHPTEPWVLSALYSGSVMIWNYDTQTLVKTIEVSALPVRNAKFIARKQWLITSSDDMQIRVFNYNTMEKVAAFEAHTDYIRHLEVHPTLPCVLSCADDMLIKLWDWEKNWQCAQVFEGHSYYVMMVKFNPKDTNTFASASLDRTIRVWGLGAAHPHFALDGHEKGVNCIDYYPGGDKPYLISGADDRTVKIWDYQTKAIIHTLDGHANNLTAVLYHPRLPLIISACEDGAVRMWHATTYRAETTLNYGMERAWSLAALGSANKLAIGYDDGTVVVRLGRDTPVVSMDDASGKLIWTQNNDVFTASVKGVVAELGLSDGERVPLTATTRELGSCDVYPQRVQHNSNGRYVAVCGDSEYIIYTSQQLRNKAFGAGLDFCWSPSGTGDYVVRESTTKLTLFKNFKEHKSDRPRAVATADGLFGGTGAIGVKGADCVAMYDWDELRLIRRIDVAVKSVFWSENGSLVVLACADSFFVLRYNKDVVSQAFAAGTNTVDDGVDGAFELLHEIADKVGTGTWVGDCFLFTTASGARLSYYVGGEVLTLAHLEQKLYLLGYLPRENVAFLMDKSKHVVSYTVSRVLLEYQTAVVRRDFEAANAILPLVPPEQIDGVARFLESQGFKEEALALSTDPDQKFDLAVQLARLDVARDIMLHEIDSSAAGGSTDVSTETQHKWKQLGDLALNDCQLALAEDCAVRAEDFSLLLLLYTSRGDRAGLEKLAARAAAKRRFNIAFACSLLLGESNDCVNVLADTKRLPEAAFFARSYCPSALPRVMDKWRDDLAAVSARAAKALADPERNPELFANLTLSQQAEAIVAAQPPAAARDYAHRLAVFESESVLHAVLSGAFGSASGDSGVHVGVGGDVDAVASALASVATESFEDAVTTGDAEAQAAADAAALAAETRALEQAETLARAQAQAHADAVARAEAEAHADAVARAEAEAQHRAQAEAAQRAQAEALAMAQAQADYEAAQARERAEREHAERERAEHERAQHERAERERAERERAERERAEHERAERERAEQAAQAEREAAAAHAREQAEHEARVRAEAQAQAQAELETQRRAQEAAQNAFSASASSLASSTSSSGAVDPFGLNATGAGSDFDLSASNSSNVSTSSSHQQQQQQEQHVTTSTHSSTTHSTPAVAAPAAPASGLLDFELENEDEMQFEEDDDADWGEM